MLISKIRKIRAGYKCLNLINALAQRLPATDVQLAHDIVEKK